LFIFFCIFGITHVLSVEPEELINLPDAQGLLYSGFMPVPASGIIDNPGVYSLSSDIEPLSTSSAIQIISNDIVLDGMGRKLQPLDNTSNILYGIEIGTESSRIHNISIRNFTATGFNSGVIILNSDKVIISGSSFSNNEDFGIQVKNSYDITFFESEISSNAQAGNLTGNAGVQISDSDSVILQSCIIISNGKGDAGSGISVIHSSSVSVDETIVSKNAANGLEIDGQADGLIIRRSEISSNGANGITISSGSIAPIISENRIHDNRMTNLDITSVSQGMISGNIIESGRIGLALSNCEDFSMAQNNLKSNTINFDVTGSMPAHYSHSIDTSNRADGRSIWYIMNKSGLTIGPSSNPACVYLINCSDTTISDLIFSRNGAGIFLINSQNISISRIAALYNIFGTRIGFGSQNVRISDCNAEKNLIAGYAVTSSDSLSFSSCTALNNLVGFHISSAQNISVASCHADGQEGVLRRGPSGFQISDCTQVNISGSTAEKNQFNGIYLKGTKSAEIVGNSLSSNSIAGIVIISDEAQVKENKISSNKAGGILVYANESVITKNQISNNAGRGLAIDGVIGGNIWDNYFNNTKNVQLSGEYSKLSWNTSPIAGIGISGAEVIAGNFWGTPDLLGYSDLCKPGSEGLCSQPYVIESGEIDYYPLTRPEVRADTSENKSRLENSFLIVDVNGNEQINLQDVIALFDKISQGIVLEIAYDYNKDGIVNLQDVIVLFDLITEM